MANAFATKYDLKKGDAVTIFMENKPEFVGLWLGLSKLGVISALLNTNLRRAPLIHCIKVAKPKIVVYGEELEEREYSCTIANLSNINSFQRIIIFKKKQF